MPLLRRRRSGYGPTTHRVNIIEEFEPTSPTSWADSGIRLGLVPPKEVLNFLNSEIVSQGGKAVSAVKLAKAIRPAEIAAEVHRVFDQIQDLLDAS